MAEFLVNGQKQQQLHVADRGLSYGDGVFETIAVVKGKALLWNAHLQRMRMGAKRLNIDFCSQLEEDFYADFQLLCAAFESSGVLKLILTRGIGERGYKIDPSAAVTRIAVISSLPDMSFEQQQGISVFLCRTQLARQPLLAGIKHLNRLEQVIARSEWSDPSITEGLVCDTQGNIIEGCMSNLFWLHDNQLFTPDLSFAGVAGVVRDALIELCKIQQIIEAKQGHYPLLALASAEEMFVCNSVFGILPVVDVKGGNPELIFSNAPLPIGALTQTLQQRLQQFYLKVAWQ
jgi:4-amino-4-deoxychorismate lyase